MDVIPTDLTEFLRPLISFQLLIGIDFGPSERRHRLSRFAFACYTLVCIAINSSTNVTRLVLAYKQSTHQDAIEFLEIIFMYCTFIVQVLGCHFGLVWMACFHWAKLSSSLLNIFHCIEIDGKLLTTLRKLSMFGIAFILTVIILFCNSFYNKNPTVIILLKNGLQEVAFSWHTIWFQIQGQDEQSGILEILDIVNFYAQIYSTSAVVLFSILAWALVLSYRAIGERIQGVRKQLNGAFQREFSRNLHNWATWVDMVDNCCNLMNQAFVAVLFIEIISIFFRILSMSTATWEAVHKGDYSHVPYSLPTITKYLLHLWLICYTADANINEVRS